jgi:hypothetical protein
MTIKLGSGKVVALSQNVQQPKAEGYNIQVGNNWYRTIANNQVPIQMGTKDSLAQRVDQGGSIYSNVLDIGYAWGRTDLSGGEGLDWDPREIAREQDQVALDIIRYWDSEGINNNRPDTAGEQYSLRLARGFQLWDEPVTDPIDLAVSATLIYVADADTVHWHTSWDEPESGSDTPAPGVNIRAMDASPNNTVMVTLVDGSVWAKKADAVVFTLVYAAAGQTFQAFGVWYVNGRFIVSAFDQVDSATLFEIVWIGSPTDDWVPQPEFDTASAPFFSIVESGPAIIAACSDGTVRSYTPDNSAEGAMELLPRSRTTMPGSESPILLGSNAGALLILTAADVTTTDRQELRLYQAEVLDARFDFVVGQIQLKRQWLGTEHEPDVNRNMIATRDEIMFFVKEERENTVTGLTLFLESLWSFDLVTSGLTRVVTADIVENIPDPIQAEQINLNAIVIFDGILGAIDFTALNVVLSDPTKFNAAGYMVMPNITFGLNTPITWISTVLEAHNLADSGGQVELWRSTNPQAIMDWRDPSWVLVQRLSSQGGSNVEIPFSDLRSRTLSLQLRIFASEGTTVSPHVTRIALRGIPAHRDFIMVVPFNISDMVSAPGRTPLHVPYLGNTLHEEVLELVGKNVNATVLDPFVRFQGVVNNISEPVTYLSDRGSVTTYVMVEFRGTRVQAQATVPPTGDDGMGLGTMGIATIGLGQTEET